METTITMPMAFPPLPVIPAAIVSLIIASTVHGRPFSAIGHSMQQRQQQQRLHEDVQLQHQLLHQPNIQNAAAINYPTTIISTMEEESHKSSELLLRGVRMHEVSAFVILVVCLILTIALVLFVGFYCLIHCWKHHKESITAAHRRALIQTSIVSTAIDDMAPPSSGFCSPSSRLSSRRSTFVARLSIFGGSGGGNRKSSGGSGGIGGHSSRSPSTARSVRGRYLDDYSDMALLNGKLPQIRISFSSAGQDSPESRCRSRLSTTSSILPPWMEGRNSIVHTPQTPGSPISFGSACKEPLLGIERSNTFSFWQRFSGGGGRSSSVSHDNNGSTLLRINMENGHNDDREIDNRSVLHYELGSYEKTKTTCFRGTLTFSLRYDFIHRVLMLHVIRANHLNNCQEKNSAPHPYVKMYLLPERRNHCKTRMIKKSSDPEFNEMFSFDVSYNNLPNRMLQFTVYDFDRFTRHGLVGNVIMRDLFDKSELLQWTEYTMQIVGSQEKNDFGDLLLYLAYSVTNKKLFITVAKAYNLRPMDITGASDPYVRCEQIYQRKRIKLRKTSIKRANLNPVYHECLEFDLAPNQIEETNILIQVMDWDRIGRDDLLGCCVLGKESPTKEGRQQWEQVFNSIRSSTTNLTKDGNHSLLPNGNVIIVNEVDEVPIPAGGGGDEMSKAVGQWHSILGEVPEGFRNIPKANKKHVQRSQTPNIFHK